MAELSSGTTDTRPPTPAFVIDLETLERFYGRFSRALERFWPNATLAYSFKTNSLPWLITYMKSRGAWAEVVSDTEYELALALGYGPDQVVYNGPIKSRDRLRAALTQGSVVNLDANREVRWTCELARDHPGQDVAVGLRVNWDLEAMCPGESATAQEGGRFGFNLDNGEFDRAVDELTQAGVRISGLHLHSSSLSRSAQVFRAAATVAAELITSRGLDLDFVDIGGGFFGGEAPGDPTFDDYIGVIRDTLGEVVDPARTRLIVEPGRSLVAVPIEFHTSVIDVKNVGPHTIVVTDGSRTNIDPTFRRKAPYQYQLVTSSAATSPSQIVSGFTCMEHDRLMRLNDAPALTEGDRIVYLKVGAYSMCFQPLFIEFLPPVYVREGDMLIPVRERWGVAEFLQGNSRPGSPELPMPPLRGDNVTTDAAGQDSDPRPDLVSRPTS
ncbi:diaminopimelate decarboxylase [Georgenia daeguensis]|uniref:Diaminopimelate decarboxylase n=1 Tax=Georgenia daeguensis TaxID=908355 RepID=A0ABP8EYS0_9MICO